jgi:hypothetical protein
MPSARKREPIVPARVKVAIAFLIEQKADLQLAAAHAGLTTAELRRAMGRPHVLRHARAERRAALEALCLSSPATFMEVLRGQNEMAKGAAIKTAEALKEGAIELERRSAQRKPGLQIVIIQRDGSQELVPMSPSVPMLDVTPVPEAEPVPSDLE